MDDTERLHSHEKLTEAFEQMLGGTISCIEGSRIVSALTKKAGYDSFSEPFIRFVAIDSETDAIPLGSVRELWAPAAVAKHAAEWSRAEAWAKKIAEPACRDALRMLRAATGE